MLAIAAWVRRPGFSQGGFVSHDVGGILYNAMLLHAGRLPYVDSVEFKGPGTFYLAYLLAGAEGRDIATFQVFANLWGLGSLLGVTAIGAALWGARAGWVTGTLYGLHDAVLDSMDANYVTWAQLPAVLAVLLAVLHREPGPGRTRVRIGYLAAGAAAGFAILCKQPAAAVLVPLSWMALSHREHRGPACQGLALGVVLAHLPVLVHYAAAGALGAFLEGYAASPWAARYVLARRDGPLVALAEGTLATVQFVGLPLALAAWSTARSWMRGDRRHELVWLVAWAVATLAAAAIGARFYKGYFLAVAPALCLLAAMPGTTAGVGAGARWVGGLPVVVALAVMVPRQLWILGRAIADRGMSHDEGVRRLAVHVREQTGRTDTVWVWGWHLWDLHALSGRLSACRVYKSFGLLTPPNDDTWRRPATNQHFVEGPYADMVLADLQAGRPAFVILGATAPHREFVALHQWLDGLYERDRTIVLGRAEIWRRREPAGQHGAR